MRISIKNFCVVKKAEFEIENGVTVIAGKNGSGKSQSLIAIAYHYGCITELNYLIEYEFGFKKDVLDRSTVRISPPPHKVLWRPPIRKIGEGTKREEYATVGPLKNIDPATNKGYTILVEDRYSLLHNRIANIFVAGNISNSNSEDVALWQRIKNAFNNVFNKDIEGLFTRDGCKVGLVLEGGLSSFATLSSGELEFLSLLTDLLAEPRVDLFLIDDIDAHFHPNLQMRIVSEIEDVVRDKKVIVVSHSPALMLSASPGKLFFMKHFSEVSPGENQIVRLSEDLTLISSLSEMYVGFTRDIRLSAHFLEAANYELLEYAQQCLENPEIKSAVCKESDPQVGFLRAVVLTKTSDFVLVEIGAGKGRLLNAFKSLPDNHLDKIMYIGIDIVETNLEEIQAYVDELSLKERFKSFSLAKSLSEADAYLKYDVCILANVIHEVSPLQLDSFFSTVLSKSKKGSQILIIEALELPVGEKGFVLFDGEAIRNIFERCLSDLYINSSNPKSYGGVPLLELLITINTDNNIVLSKEDIERGLNKVIDTNAMELANHLKKNVFNARTLAFKCHNLANAQAYLKMIGKGN